MVCLIFAQACASARSDESKPVTTGVEVKSEFPFSTREPEIYQADFYVGGDDTYHRHIARKGGKWRLDFFRNGQLSVTHLIADKVYSIDHVKRLYAVRENSSALETGFGDTTFSFFKWKEHLEFEKIGVEENLSKYRVREGSSKDDIFIYVDETSGMIVRQEFKVRAWDGSESATNFVYEIKNLRIEVEDMVFEVPDGYRKVALTELWPDKISY